MQLRIDHNNGTPLHLQVERLVREFIEKDHSIIVDLSREEIKLLLRKKILESKIPNKSALLGA